MIYLLGNALKVVRNNDQCHVVFFHEVQEVRQDMFALFDSIHLPTKTANSICTRTGITISCEENSCKTDLAQRLVKNNNLGLGTKEDSSKGY